MDALYACPFCRQLFTPGEVSTCPECDIRVQPLAELPESHDGQALEPEDPVEPEHEVLPWGFMGRGRGSMTLLSAAGLGSFVAPWLHETAPEIRTWSGYEFAQQLPWLWAAGVAWFVLLALVISRRTVMQMRGARVAVAFLAAIVLMTVALRLILTPSPPHPLVPLRFAYGWGMYLSGFLSLTALVLAPRFGGSSPSEAGTARLPR